jgi:predicted DCC family thiol-disulfide oxidoreductase YuxK
MKHHTIIYDDECPMCDLYTKGFVQSGMLDQNGRVPFSKMNDELLNLIDRERSCNEIALVNLEKQEVVYGIDSLFAIISNRLPFLKSLFGFKPFRWTMKKLYSFISYNRKVIVPGKVFEGQSSCVPSFSTKYRWAYIIVAWLMTALVLTYYSSNLYPLIPASTMSREFLICGGQIIFQWAVVRLLNKDRVVHYLGNMMTVSFMGALLLLPGMLLTIVGVDAAYVYAAWFLMVAGVMLLEHMRRVKILGIHWSASLSWVLYRLIVLLIIL